MAGRSKLLSVPTRRGFTLVELLVVVAIIAVLFAMLLPAVQRVRDAAARAQCANNLKQIGLALINYDEQYGHLPASNEVEAPGPTTQIRANWAIRILPFLELQSIYDNYKELKLNTDLANEHARETYVRVYICPADPMSHEPDKPSTGPGQNIKYRPSNYRAMTGRSDGSNFFEFVNNPESQSPSAKILSHDWRGPMHVYMPSANLYWERLSNIPDGTTNTILAGEYSTSTEPARRAFWAYSFGGYAAGAAIPDGRTLIPDFHRCATTLGAGELACGRGWGSFHAGGTVINFVMCDGSVRAISSGIQVDLFASLGSIAGGEVILEAN
jgi:prepilin-type N-terminal cleavage/methylation domain-containing protein/prepilin-type processing-associated H-X9-DG protein